MENVKTTTLKKLMVIVMSFVMISTAFCVCSADESYGATNSISKQRITGVKLTQPTSCKKIKVSWSKKSNMTGYEIYRATAKNGKYTFKKRLTKTTWTNEGLTLGKTYYYKIRGFKKVNGKRIYTKFSYAKGLKTAYISPTFTLKTNGKSGKLTVTIKNSKYGKNLKVYLNDVAGFIDESEKRYDLTNIKRYVSSTKKYVNAGYYVILGPSQSIKFVGTVNGGEFNFKNTMYEFFYSGVEYRGNNYIIAGNSFEKASKKID